MLVATKDTRLCNHACSFYTLLKTHATKGLQGGNEARVSKHDTSLLFKEGFRVCLTQCTFVYPYSWQIPDYFIGILPPFPSPTPPWRYPPAKVGLIFDPTPAVPVPTTDDAKEARVEGSGAKRSRCYHGNGQMLSGVCCITPLTILRLLS